MYNLAGRKCKIVGQSFRSFAVQEAFEEKNNGTKLLLIRESDNPHDKYAIGVYAALTIGNADTYEWRKVGHIAAEEARSPYLASISGKTVVEAKKLSHTQLELTSLSRTYS